MKVAFLARLGVLFLSSLSAALADPGVLQFSQPGFTASESDFITVDTTRYLTPTMTVTRTGGSTGALTVSYCVWPSEVADNAVESTNYVLADNMRRWVAAGTLTWADGDTAPKLLPFSYTAFGQTRYNLTPSSAVQGTVTYSARLANVTGGATLGPDATARLHILDAEAPAAGVFNFSSRRFHGPDGGGVVVTVRRDGGSAGAVSVNYATSSTLPAVGGNQQLIGAGVSGTHYTATSGTLSWASGDVAAKTFTVALPATGSTNGPLNVALNLSSPSGGGVLGTTASALLTIQNTASTVFDINDHIDNSTFRVSLPPGPGPVRGVLFWWPGTGGDDRHFTTDPNFRKIADLWRFAIASPRGNFDPTPNRDEFPQPRLGFLADRLTQIALTTGRPEIAYAPFVLSGMSAGSYSASRSLNIWPERTIAALGQEGWNYPPLPLTANTLGPLAKEIPALNVGGQLDATQSPPSTIFPAFNEFRKAGLTRAAVMMSWGRGHTFSNTGAAYNSVALHWLDQVMSAGRYPAALAPTSTTAPALGSLSLSSGWWGARNSTNSTTNSYELSGGSSRFLAIGPDATYAGVKDVNNALVDSWLPTEAAARAYRAFVSLPSITFSAPAQLASGLVGNPVTLSVSENGYGAGLAKIEFYDGNNKVGEDTTSPFSFAYTPAAAGARGLTAVASTASGPAYTAFTLFLASDPAAPTISAGQSSSGVVGLPFSHQLAAGGPPTGYALASGTLPPGVTLNTGTGLLSGTPTTAGTYTPAFTATNSVGTSAPVSVTFTITATAGLIVHEPFAYPVGTNNPDPDAGLNSGNGLPATNVGGSPAGTGTGLRTGATGWDITTDVVAGLAYAQGSKTFVTTGGAARVNNATWGGQPYLYRSMTTDPFLPQRIGATNAANLGVDGTSLFVSLLGSTSSATADAFRFSFKYDGTANFYLTNTSSGWSLNGTTAAGAPLSLNTPTLFVLRFDFAAGATDSVHLWVNPPLGQALGTPSASVTGIHFPGLSNFQTRAAVAGAMTLDELRVGTSLAAVTPYTEPPPLTAQEQWRATWFGTSTNSGSAADSADPDGDGITNSAEYVAGTDPLAPGAPATAPASSLPARLVSLAPAADAHVESSNPNSNFSNSDLLVRSESNIREAFLRYDLSALAGTVERAQLVFWPTNNDSQLPTYTLERIADAADAWTETGLTWNNKPASVSGTGVSFSGPVGAGVPRVLDLTALVADTLANDAARQLGLRLSAAGSMPTQAASFGSKENGGSFRQPYLHVTLRASSATPVRILHAGDSITRGSAGGVGSNTFSNSGSRYYLHNLLLASGVDFRAVGPRADGSIAAFRLGADGSFNSALLDRPLLFPANAGYSGQQISYLRDNIAAWIAAGSPDVITLMIGTNDVGYSNSPSFATTTTELNNWKIRYAALLDNILAASPSVKVVMATITPAGGVNAPNNSNRIEPFNTNVVRFLFGQYSAAHPGRFFLVDNYAALTTADISADNVHPTSLGHQKLARSWHAGLTAALGRDDEIRFLNESLGADASLHGGSNAATAFGNATGPLSPGWTSALLRAKSDPAPGLRAKILLKFDLAGLPARFASATLGFAYHGTTPTGNLPATPTLLHLYGVKDGGDAWAKSTVTWNSAPGHDSATNGVLAPATVYLASVTVPAAARTGDLVTFTSAALRDFLTSQSGPDDLASFVIVASGRQSEEAVLHATNQPDYQPVFLVVTPESDPLATFRATHGLATDGSQDLLAPAGDGVANLLKYAFNMIGAGAGQGSTLSTPNAAVLTPATTVGLPFVSLTPTLPHSLAITYVRRKAATYPGITYAVDFSDTLASDSWAANPAATESVVSLDDTFERVTVTDSVSVPARRFVRVRVAAP